nr:PAS domain-containing hybrid sensor histidine kinase/response regulator [Sagittula salina]
MIAVLRLARQREREARLNHETRERLETIVSTSLDAVVVIDQTDRVIEWNGAAERVFGYTNREAVGAEMSSLIVPEHFRPMHRQAMQRYARTGVGRVVGRGIVQLEARHKDGSIFPVDLSLAEAQGPRGEIFVAFMRDITDRVRAEQALRRARDRAVAGEKQKAELLAVMSHEMRTPLNGILGTLDLCETEQLDEKNRRHLRIIRQSGEVLLSHVNDVLDISRLDAGKMPLRKRRFDLVALMREIIDSQTPRASALGNKLHLLPPSPELHNAYSDPDRLRQILLNLVSNAIKFTRNGRITLEADVSEGLNAVELRVTDTGDGIAAQDLGRIFDDFVTIDSSYGRRNTGTGLGLGISQRLAVALGGELGAESEPGDGSLFWVRLPMDPPADAPVARIPANEPQAAPPRALDVLLVEDNAINREVARQMLERDGHRVTITEDGQQGLDAAAVRRFDVILMDISMPGLDGMTAARMIRAGKGPNVRTPIVATTAHALPEEVRAFRAVGMDRVLTKPITVASLRRTLTEMLGRGGVTTPDPEAASGGTDASQALAETAPPRIDAAHFREVTEELADDHLRAMLANCAKEIDRFLDHLPEALAAPDPTFGSLSQEAHRLAGSAGVFGALPMAGLLRQFQTMARSEDLAALCTQGRELARCWDETCAELARRGYAEQVDAND